MLETMNITPNEGELPPNGDRIERLRAGAFTRWQEVNQGAPTAVTPKVKPGPTWAPTRTIQQRRKAILAAREARA